MSKLKYQLPINCKWNNKLGHVDPNCSFFINNNDPWGTNKWVSQAHYFWKRDYPWGTNKRVTIQPGLLFLEPIPNLLHHNPIKKIVETLSNQ
mmetsp:Transcript_12558/g.15913  ORF Transcript_12558/g.15913 Transcript_12558/m.15913 type:complete len:92 (-) Transcript_12558:42-317(-)